MDVFTWILEMSSVSRAQYALFLQLHQLIHGNTQEEPQIIESQ